MLNKHWVIQRKLRTSIKKYLKGYKKLGDRTGEGNVLRALGDTERRAGNFDAAQQHYKKALETFHQENNRIGEGLALKALGELEYKAGRTQEARKLSDKS